MNRHLKISILTLTLALIGEQVYASDAATCSTDERAIEELKDPMSPFGINVEAARERARACSKEGNATDISVIIVLYMKEKSVIQKLKDEIRGLKKEDQGQKKKKEMEGLAAKIMAKEGKLNALVVIAEKHAAIIKKKFPDSEPSMLPDLPDQEPEAR